MVICINIDNVLNNLAEKAIGTYNESAGDDIQISDIVRYKISECLPEKAVNDIMKICNQPDFWDSLVPLSDSQWGLKTLTNTNHEIYLITSTHPEFFVQRVEWIKKCYPFINTNSIVHITNKNLLKCDVMIDACLEDLTSNICERICLDYPWNRGRDKDFAYDIIRVHSWKDIVNTIDEIERKNEE